MGKKSDLSGMRFGRFTVVEFHSNNKHNQTMWRCRCDCGNERIVCVGNLNYGVSKSCGCLKSEKLLESITKHGLHNTREYKIWKKMRQRCRNPLDPAYPDYGGRGILVCKRWDDFSNFIADMGTCPDLTLSIDRFPNNDGNYEPGNCRWATRTEQARNKRSNHIIKTSDGKMSIAEAAERNAMPYARLKARLELGWKVIDAVREPGRQHSYKRIEGAEHIGKVIFLPHGGRRYSIAEASKCFNVGIRTLLWRLHHGWSIEKALKTKPRLMGRAVM